MSGLEVTLITDFVTVYVHIFLYFHTVYIYIYIYIYIYLCVYVCMYVHMQEFCHARSGVASRNVLGLELFHLSTFKYI